MAAAATAAAEEAKKIKIPSWTNNRIDEGPGITRRTTSKLFIVEKAI